MKKKAMFVVLGVFAVMASFAACSTVQPDAGHEAVLVRKPLIFGSGGVDATPVKTGLKYVAFTTEGVDVNMQPRRIDSEFTDLMTSDGVPIDFHAVITPAGDRQREAGARLRRRLGGANGTPGFWMRNLDQPFRTAVRDAVKAHGMNEMAIQATAAEGSIRSSPSTCSRSSRRPACRCGSSTSRSAAPIRPMRSCISASRPPRRSSASTPRSRRSSRRISASSAEESRAAADQAYNQKMGLNTEQYVALQAIQMQRDVCAKGTCTFIYGANATPMLNLRQ